VKLLHEDWFSGVLDVDGNPIVTQTYYPPAISRPEPRWLQQLLFPFGGEEERKIGSLLREIYSALHNGSRTLAVMGARALLEHLMLSRISDQGSFVKNLDLFQNDGFLSSFQREMVESILEAGHAAMHRGYIPTTEDVNVVIDVTESLVESLYVHSKMASSLGSRIPARKKNA
jgi:hypothetical protein